MRKTHARYYPTPPFGYVEKVWEIDDFNIRIENLHDRVTVWAEEVGRTYGPGVVDIFEQRALYTTKFVSRFRPIRTHS